MPRAIRVPTEAEVNAYDLDALRKSLEQHQANIVVFQEKIQEEQGHIQHLSAIIQRKMELMSDA